MKLKMLQRPSPAFFW